MSVLDKKPLYRHTDVALLRAATAPLTNAPDQWPDLADTGACRVWLDQMWSRPDLADAVRQASPSLGGPAPGPASRDHLASAEFD